MASIHQCSLDRLWGQKRSLHFLLQPPCGSSAPPETRQHPWVQQLEQRVLALLSSWAPLALEALHSAALACSRGFLNHRPPLPELVLAVETPSLLLGSFVCGTCLQEASRVLTHPARGHQPSTRISFYHDMILCCAMPLLCMTLLCMSCSSRAMPARAEHTAKLSAFKPAPPVWIFTRFIFQLQGSCTYRGFFRFLLC